MSGSSLEEIKLVIENVKHKKVEGVLYLMNERLAWMPKQKTTLTTSHHYVDIKSLFVIFKACTFLFRPTIIFDSFSQKQPQLRRYPQRAKLKCNSKSSCTTTRRAHFTSYRRAVRRNRSRTETKSRTCSPLSCPNSSRKSARNWKTRRGITIALKRLIP